MPSTTPIRSPTDPFGAGGAVRVLIASDSVAARLALEAVLEKGGYFVESAVSAADAMEQLEAQSYDLVLCNLESDCSELQRFASMQEHRPATATVHVSREHGAEGDGHEVLIGAVNLQQLLTQVADLVANRAFDRAERSSTLSRRKTA